MDASIRDMWTTRTWGFSSSRSPEWILSRAVTTSGAELSDFGTLPYIHPGSRGLPAFWRNSWSANTGMRWWAANVRMSDGTQVSISQLQLPVYYCRSSLPSSSSDVSVPRRYHSFA